jgi:hypothetical protein
VPQYGPEFQLVLSRMEARAFAEGVKMCRVMRRALRTLLNVTAVLSLLLCVAMLVLWVRAGWVAEAASWSRPGGDNGNWEQFEVFTSGNGLRLGHLAVTQSADAAHQNAPPSSSEMGLQYNRGQPPGMLDPVDQRTGRAGLIPGDVYRSWQGFAY